MDEAAAKARHERSFHWMKLGIVQWSRNVDFGCDTQKSRVLHFWHDVEVVKPSNEIDFTLIV